MVVIETEIAGYSGQRRVQGGPGRESIAMKVPATKVTARSTPRIAERVLAFRVLRKSLLHPQRLYETRVLDYKWGSLGILPSRLRLLRNAENPLGRSWVCSSP